MGKCQGHVIGCLGCVGGVGEWVSGRITGRHEEDAEEDALKRHDVGTDLRAEVGVGEEHARGERARGVGQPELLPASGGLDLMSSG
eukprot:5264777-Prymnesium_polylepis.1